MVRLLSYNVRSLRDDPAAAARVVRALAPDVVCVQEAPRFWRWRSRRDRFAADCGMVNAVGRRAAGLSLMTRPGVRVVHSQRLLLERIPRLHRRGLALAVLEFDGARLIVGSTHLDLVDGPRLRHVEEILGVLDRARGEFGAPVVLAGDVNEEPGGAAWGRLAAALQDGFAVAPSGEGPTFSAADPGRRIDGVFADHDLEVAGCGVPDLGPLNELLPRATDHRPLLAELAVRG